MELNKPDILLVANTMRASGMPVQHRRVESASAVLNTVQDVHNNISIQPGQDFSVEFGHDGIAGGRVLAAPDSLRKHEPKFELHRENGHVRYGDLTNILGLTRMDSGNPFDIADLALTKEPVQEMENGVIVNKFSKNQKEDGNCTHGLRKAFSESVGDQANNGTPGSSFLRKESSYSNGFSALGVSDDSQSGKIKFLCSFGGKILPRPSDGKLRYVGGETRIISIQKNMSWEELVKKTLGICEQPHTIKYQLPGEDLDALISVSSDEDLQNMIEEYHGPERHEGSQRLRIFLIPLNESEKESSFEASTIQQIDPDYQYVVAVNGIGDCNPRINVPRQDLTSGASPLGTNLKFAPDFHESFTNAHSASEINAGHSARHPDGSFDDSQNLHWSSSQHQPISPNLFQGGNSNAVYTQPQGINSCQGSADSSLPFITAQLSPDTSNVSAADCRFSQQMAVTFLSDSHPCQLADGGLPEQHYGRHFGNYNPSQEFMTASYASQRDGYNDEISGERSKHKDHSENPFSCLGESICPQYGSDGTTNSLIGIPHAFSDSKLHENAIRSGYCSQEGISQFSSLNLSKAQLSSVAASVPQSGPIEVQHNPSLIYPQIQSKVPNIESAELHRRQDLPFSFPSTESFGVNEPVNKDSILYNKRNPFAQTDLSVSTFVERQCEDNSVTVEMMKRIEDKNCLQSRDSNLYKVKSPAITTGVVNELHLLDSFPTANYNVKINKPKQWEQSSEDMISASSGTTGISQNNLIEETPSDFLDLSNRTSDGKECDLAEGLKGEPGFDFLLTRNSGLNGSFQNCEGNSCGKSSLGDHLFELPIDSVSHEYAQVQPSFQKDTGLHETPTVSSEFLYSAVLYDEPGPSSNLPMNDLQNPSNAFKRVPSLLDDDFIASTDQMVDQFTCGTLACETKVEDIMLGQSKNLEKCDETNKMEPLIVVEDVTGVVPSGVESLPVPTTHIVEEIGIDVLSPSATEVESTIPDSVEMIVINKNLC